MGGESVSVRRFRDATPLAGRSWSECLHLRLDSLARTIGGIRGFPSGSALIL